MSGFRKTLQGLSLLLTFTLCSFSHALGLGAFHLYSSLNEPLDAEVEILQAQNYDLDALKAMLAPLEEYQQANLPRPRDKFRFDLRQFKNLTFIHLTSDEPIRQAYLDFLLELNWPHGRIIRAYNVLLDPPSLLAQEVKRLSDLAEQEAMPAVIDKNLKLATALSPIPVPASVPVLKPSPVEGAQKTVGPSAPLPTPAQPVAPPTPSVTLSPVKPPTVLSEDITDRIQAANQLSASEILNFNKMRGIEHNLRQLFDPEIKTDSDLKPSPPLSPAVSVQPVSHPPPPAVPLQETHSVSSAPKPSAPLPPPAVPQPVMAPGQPKQPIVADKAPMGSPLDYDSVRYGLMALCALMLAMGIRIAWLRQKAQGKLDEPAIQAAPAATLPVSHEAADLSPEGSLDNEMFLKLELARGYASINELDNAREALDEVLAKGNDFQKQEAEQILASF